MKSDFGEQNYECIDIKRKVSQRRHVSDYPQNEDVFQNQLPKLWPNGKPIAEPKLRDIISIKHLIPEDALDFYNNLKISSEELEDVIGVGIASSFHIKIIKIHNN